MTDDTQSAVATDLDLQLAEKFLKYDFPETKDLCKQFLTLISGLLVVSVTFSDKVVPAGATHFRVMLIISWFLFLAAIVGTGAGLYLIFVAGSYATYRPARRRWRNRLQFLSFSLLNIAGVSFVAGLVLLIVSGLASARHG